MAATECVATNALLTLRLAEYIAANSCARFVYGSTGQVYRFQGDCVKECAPVDVTRRACFYLSSKLLGETYVERTRAIGKLNAVILRIGSCYGPLMPARALVARFVDMAKQRAPLTLLHGGLERFDMVYVDDVLELLVRAAASAEEGVFHAGSGRSVTVKAIAQAVNTAFGNDVPIIVDETATMPLQPGFAPLCMEKSMAAFGLQPRTFEDGINSFRDWDETSHHQ